MHCPLCASGHEAEFTAEMVIHFRGLKNVDKPGVWVFPILLVCLECGSSRFSVPEKELVLLASSAPASERSTAQQSLDERALPIEFHRIDSCVAGKL